MARPAANIAMPWVCIALFAVLGTTFILAQPTAVEHSFGSAGFAFMLASCLVGWAIGFEMGAHLRTGYVEAARVCVRTDRIGHPADRHGRDQ